MAPKRKPPTLAAKERRSQSKSHYLDSSQCQSD